MERRIALIKDHTGQNKTGKFALFKQSAQIKIPDNAVAGISIFSLNNLRHN